MLLASSTTFAVLAAPPSMQMFEWAFVYSNFDMVIFLSFSEISHNFRAPNPATHPLPTRAPFDVLYRVHDHASRILLGACNPIVGPPLIHRPRMVKTRSFDFVYGGEKITCKRHALFW